VLELLGAVFLAQAIFLIGIGIGLAIKQDDYLASLGSKISADGRIDAGAQTMLHALLHEQGWIFIAVIIVLLIMGVCYDVLTAYLNSFFKQRAWNGISLLAGMLPQLSAVVAIVGAQFSPDPLRWSIVGILITSGLAPTIAVAIATWQVVVIWRAGHDVAPAPASIEPNTSWIPAGFLRYTGVSYLMTMTDFVASKSFAIYLTNSISDAAMLLPEHHSSAWCSHISIHHSSALPCRYLPWSAPAKGEASKEHLRQSYASSCSYSSPAVQP
jgi:hypothetical protein